jgi:hypothetical protein
VPRRRARTSRWEEDNRLRVNPWPFLVFALFAGSLVGLGFLIWWL